MRLLRRWLHQRPMKEWARSMVPATTVCVILCACGSDRPSTYLFTPRLCEFSVEFPKAYETKEISVSGVGSCIEASCFTSASIVDGAHLVAEGFPVTPTPQSMTDPVGFLTSWAQEWAARNGLEIVQISSPQSDLGTKLSMLGYKSIGGNRVMISSVLALGSGSMIHARATGLATHFPQPGVTRFLNSIAKATYNTKGQHLTGEYDYGNTRWGFSRADVIRAVGSESYEEKAHSVAYYGVRWGQRSQTKYWFTNDQLTMVTQDVFIPRDDLEPALEIVSNMLKQYREQNGQPRDIGWYSDIFTDFPGSRTGEDRAFSVLTTGDLEKLIFSDELCYLERWKNDRTSINFYLARYLIRSYYDDLCISITFKSVAWDPS